MIAPDKFLLQLTVAELTELISNAVEANLTRLAAGSAKAAPIESPIMTMKTLPTYIHMSVSKIYKLVSMGKIPHHHCGQKLLFKRADIDSWIEEQRIV